MPKKIDPLNKKNYTALTAALSVADVKAAAEFYQKAFGFQRRGIMNGPDGKPVHAELTLRGTTLMLGPEMPEMGARSANTVGASPTTLYLMVENVDPSNAQLLTSVQKFHANSTVTPQSTECSNDHAFSFRSMDRKNGPPDPSHPRGHFPQTPRFCLNLTMPSELMPQRKILQPEFGGGLK